MRDLHALLGGGLLARVGKALRSGQIDGGEILNLFGVFAADNEFLRYVLSKRHAAKHKGSGDRQSHDTKSHFVLH